MWREQDGDNDEEDNGPAVLHRHRVEQPQLQVERDPGVGRGGGLSCPVNKIGFGSLEVSQQQCHLR